MHKYVKFIMFFILLGLTLVFMTTGCSQQSGVSPEEGLAGTETSATDKADLAVANHMSDFLFKRDSVNNYFDQSLIEMGKAEIRGHTDEPSAFQEAQNMPSGFSTPLPPGGIINAPEEETITNLASSGFISGLVKLQCPAGASATVQFVTNNDEVVTPELLESIDLKIIPAGTMMYIASNHSGLSFIGVEHISNVGIRDIMLGAIDMNNQEVLMDLVTPQGWNKHLWNKLNELQEPAQSLLDYHLWNLMDDLEEVIIAEMRQELQAYGVPQMVLDAFDKSANRGWFANRTPTEQDAFARMEVEAVMTGSVSGTVYERREIAITGLNQPPQYGIHTGEGTVVFESPEFGTITFIVDIAFDQFDEKGRAIGGEVRAVDINNEYEVIFIYLPDGTKEGELYKNGVLVGVMTMEVDYDRFQNYIDVETGDSLEL